MSEITFPNMTPGPQWQTMAEPIDLLPAPSTQRSAYHHIDTAPMGTTDLACAGRLCVPIGWLLSAAPPGSSLGTALTALATHLDTNFSRPFRRTFTTTRDEHLRLNATVRFAGEKPMGFIFPRGSKITVASRQKASSTHGVQHTVELTFTHPIFGGAIGPMFLYADAAPAESRLLGLTYTQRLEGTKTMQTSLRARAAKVVASHSPRGTIWERVTVSVPGWARSILDVRTYDDRSVSANVALFFHSLVMPAEEGLAAARELGKNHLPAAATEIVRFLGTRFQENARDTLREHPMIITARRAIAAEAGQVRPGGSPSTPPGP